MKPYQRWSLVVLAVVGGLFVLVVGVLRPLTSRVRQWFVPVTGVLAETAQQLNQTYEERAGVRDHTVEELEARVTALAVDYVRLRALEEENANLRAQAKFLNDSGFESVGARVINRDIREGRSLLTVDRGTKDGVEVGQAVVTREGVFVGKITEVTERISVILLLTDPKSRVAAALADATGLSGIVEGRGNGAAQLTYIPANTPIARDRIILTAGTEEKVPGNLPFALVNAVEGKPNDPFLSAILEPLVPLERLAFVSILRPAALGPIRE